MNRFIPALAAAVSLLGCTGPDGAPVVLIEKESYGSITLYWQHPDGAAPDGYAIETRVVPQAFAVTQTAPASQLYAVVPFPDSAPELVDYELRVRALPDLTGDRASLPVHHRRGLRTPVLQCLDQASSAYGTSCSFSSAPVHLRWVINSTAADGLLLERQPGNASSFSPLPVAFPSTSYDDSDVMATGVGYVYRLTLTKGAERSDSVTVYAH